MNFHKGILQEKAADNICAASKKDVVHHSTVTRWYHRFESGDISIEGQNRLGRPSTLHDDDLRSALISKSNITTWQLATALGCSKLTVNNRCNPSQLSKTSGTYLLHDNACPHVATVTRPKTQELG
ncbi:hypothetical protein V3C99_010133 [Haemonchus contortus]